MDKNQRNGLLAMLGLGLFVFFLEQIRNYNQKKDKIELNANYTEDVGCIDHLYYLKPTRQRKEEYGAIFKYEINNTKYTLGLELNEGYKYKFNPNVRAERGDCFTIAYSSKNPAIAEVTGKAPKLPAFYENNTDKIFGNNKMEFIELYNHGVDTFGIVTHIDCKKDSSKAIIEYPSTDGKKYKIKLEVAYYNDKKAIYKAQGLPTVRIGDSLKIRYSPRVPQVHRLLESAPNIALPRY